MMTLSALDETLKENGIESFNSKAHYAIVKVLDGHGNWKEYQAVISQLPSMVFGMEVHDVSIHTFDNFADEFPSHAEHLKTWQPLVGEPDGDGLEYGQEQSDAFHEEIRDVADSYEMGGWYTEALS